jgi:hypothetical protein
VSDETSTLPYLLELLSVKDSGIDDIPMGPEATKARILEALKRIVIKSSNEKYYPGKLKQINVLIRYSTLCNTLKERNKR